MGKNMKRGVFTALLILAMTLAAASAIANPPCPQSADRLEDFAVCMKPYPNGRGQVLVGYAAGGMDNHTAALMNSMHRTVSMPQVIPTVPAAVSLMSNMAIAATATYRWPNNYWMWGNPYLWMGMGMGMPVYYPH
jgi:hypothetical protein